MKRKAKNNRTRSKPPVDLTGRRFGKWMVLKYAGEKVRYSNGRGYLTRLWLCRCDCGVKKQVPTSNLTKGLSTKCWRCAHPKYSLFIPGTLWPLVQTPTQRPTARGMARL